MSTVEYEIVVLAIMGVSGLSAALLTGMRDPVILSASTVGFASLIRLFSAQATWFANDHSVAFYVWLFSASLVAAIASLTVWRHWRVAAVAAALYSGLAIIATSVKYLFQIGEMQHTDSADIVARALLVVQSGASDLSPLTNTPKRGLLYPIMLALGPSDRILASYTPLVFLSVLLLLIWLAWKTSAGLSLLARISATVVAFGFLATVPILRISLTYLNSHVLVAYGLSLMMTPALSASGAKTLERGQLWLLTAGGIIAITARIEGVALIGAFAIMMMAFLPKDRRGRLKFLLSFWAIGGSFLLWVWGLGTNLDSSVGVAYWQMAAIGALGSIALTSQKFRQYWRQMVLLVATALFGALAWTISTSPNPVEQLMAQWPNFALGVGGWGTFGPVALILFIVIGWRQQSREYKWLVSSAFLLIEVIFYAKSLEGGFGREGFYDSVNRMMIHVVPFLAIALAVGLAKVSDQAAKLFLRRRMVALVSRKQTPGGYQESS